MRSVIHNGGTKDCCRGSSSKGSSVGVSASASGDEGMSLVANGSSADRNFSLRAHSSCNPGGNHKHLTQKQ